MNGITTSISTLTSNVFTTSKCDKKNTKTSTSTFSKMSSFLSCVKNTPSQQSSNPSKTQPSTSSFSESSNSKEKYKIYKNLEGNTNVNIDRELSSGVKKVPGGFAIESKNSYSIFKGCNNVTTGNLTAVKNLKQSSGVPLEEKKKSTQKSSYPSASSSSVISSSKEKTRSYVSFEESAKKEKGIKIEKKGQKTNVIMSGVSGLHIGETYTYTSPKNKDS